MLSNEIYTSISFDIPAHNRVKIEADSLPVPWYVVDIVETSTQQKFTESTNLNSLMLTIEPSIRNRAIVLNATYSDYGNTKKEIKFEMLFKYEPVDIEVINVTKKYTIPQTETYTYRMIETLAGPSGAETYSVEASSISNVELIVAAGNYPTGIEQTQVGPKVSVDVSTNQSIYIGVRKASYCTKCDDVTLIVTPTETQRGIDFLMVGLSTLILLLVCTSTCCLVVLINKCCRTSSNKPPIGPMITRKKYEQIK
jgi:hypothetical protein